MDNMSKRFITIFITMLALPLSACGGAPSDGDVKVSVEKQLKVDFEKIGKLGGSDFGMLIPEIKEIKKIGCKEVGEKTYLCDVEMVLVTNGVQKQGVVQMRFVNSNSGWVVSR